MSYDYLLVGGGLQSGLLALALRHHRPTATVAVIERDERLGGNHTWSFHAGDVPTDARPWFEPLVQWRWPGYDVLFPGSTRTLDQPYGTFTGSWLDQVVRTRLAAGAGCAVITGVAVADVGGDQVTLVDGRRLAGRVVIDSRGPGHGSAASRTGYQKFLGWELRLREASAPARPIVMDARASQAEGMHFFYVLPFAPDRVLVEDTYFSNDPGLDLPRLRGRIEAWVQGRGWRVAEVVREEQGILPMPCERPPAPRGDPRLLRGGYAGGWYHPATGYSLPLAVRFAQLVARDTAGELPGPSLAHLEVERDRQHDFCYLLNRLLFEALAPSARRAVFERFYRLPADCIGRFYSLELRPADRARILLGSPPAGIAWPQAARAVGAWLRGPLGLFGGTR